VRGKIKVREIGSQVCGSMCLERRLFFVTGNNGIPARGVHTRSVGDKLGVFLRRGLCIMLSRHHTGLDCLIGTFSDCSGSLYI